MIRTNKLTQLEGPDNVGENGEFCESGDFSKILPIAKVVGEMIRANKLTQLLGLRNFGNLTKAANLAKVAILVKFRQGC